MPMQQAYNRPQQPQLQTTSKPLISPDEAYGCLRLASQERSRQQAWHQEDLHQNDVQQNSLQSIESDPSAEVLIVYDAQIDCKEYSKAASRHMLLNVTSPKQLSRKANKLLLDMDIQDKTHKVSHAACC